jgi:hypothetical protein
LAVSVSNIKSKAYGLAELTGVKASFYPFSTSSANAKFTSVMPLALAEGAVSNLWRGCRLRNAANLVLLRVKYLPFHTHRAIAFSTMIA